MHKCMTDVRQLDTSIDYGYIASLRSISPTSKKLKNTVKQIWLLKMQIQKLTSLERKADTRIKIMMGCLMKKVGLDNLHKQKAEALYGMLLAGKQQLEKNPKVLDEWTELGKKLKTSKINE